LGGKMGLRVFEVAKVIRCIFFRQSKKTMTLPICLGSVVYVVVSPLLPKIWVMRSNPTRVIEFNNKTKGGGKGKCTLQKFFFKICPGWGATLGSFVFIYFLIPPLYHWATAAPRASKKIYHVAFLKDLRQTLRINGGIRVKLRIVVKRQPGVDFVFINCVCNSRSKWKNLIDYGD
jgi:hypothetical protein